MIARTKNGTARALGRMGTRLQRTEPRTVDSVRASRRCRRGRRNRPARRTNARQEYRSRHIADSECQSSTTSLCCGRATAAPSTPCQHERIQRHRHANDQACHPEARTRRKEQARSSPHDDRKCQQQAAASERPSRGGCAPLALREEGRSAREQGENKHS